MNQESKIFFFKYWFQKKIRHIGWSSLFKQSKIWIWDSANTEFRRNTRVLCEFIHFLPLLLLLRMPMSVAQVILDMVKLWQRYLVFFDGSSSFMPWAWASLASVPAVGKLPTEPNAAWENQTGFWGVAQLFHSGSGPLLAQGWERSDLERYFYCLDSRRAILGGSYERIIWC